MNLKNNRALTEFAKVWALVGDWMQCKRCKKVLVASRDGEPMRHADGCKYSSHLHPWQELREAISVKAAFNYDAMSGLIIGRGCRIITDYPTLGWKNWSQIILRKRIAELEAHSERLRVALGWFVDDKRFVVGVGGNPNVVEPMIAEARRLYENA